MTAQNRAETTGQAPASDRQSATAVDGIRQPPVLYLMPKGGGNNSGSGSNSGNNGGGSSGTTSDPSTSYHLLAIMLLAHRHWCSVKLMFCAQLMAIK